MKHGDKAKAPKAIATGSKKSSSAKESSPGKGSKAGESSRGKEAGKVIKTPAPSTSKAASQSGSKAASGGNGKGKQARPAADEAGFTNPLVANAFKRAVKKFPNAFRKLTD